jgi:hypothetical protein
MIKPIVGPLMPDPSSFSWFLRVLYLTLTDLTTRIAFMDRFAAGNAAGRSVRRHLLS